MRALVGLVLIHLFTGCQTTSSLTPMGMPLEYLDTTAITELKNKQRSVLNPIEIDDKMTEFISGDIRSIKSPRVRAVRIVKELANQGYYTDSYEVGLTYTATEAFQQRRGNCLAYTHMYIALARLAGLDARYEVVNIPPTFVASGGVLEHQMHIRVRVLLPFSYRGESFLTVDFNQRNTQLKGKLVSDDWATSLHLSNDAVVHWQKGDFDEARKSISTAIFLTPNNPDLWVNLSTFYGSVGRHDVSRQLSLYALTFDRHHLIALATLADGSNGEDTKAYEAKLKRHREKNAYYQYALAQKAEHQQHLDKSLAYINRAIEIRRREAEFYTFKANLLVLLDQVEAAIQNYQTALAMTKSDAEKEHLLSTIQELRRSEPTDLS